jgi:predicted exporter
MSEAGVRGLTVALLAALGLYCASRLEFTNSITHFLPSESEAELVELALELVESPLSRRMVLVIGGGDDAARSRAAAELAGALRSHPEVDWVEAGFDDEALRSLYELYFPRRVYLASDAPGTGVPALLTDRALDARAARLRQRLAQPIGVVASKTAPDDPLGLFDRVIDRIRAGWPAASGADGRLVSVDGEHAAVLIGLRSSPFDSGRQAGLLRDIESAFARLDVAAEQGLMLEQSGVNRIAVATEQSVRADVELISALSITGVCLLFLGVFRSLRHLLVALLAPLAGFAAATAVVLTFSAPLHGITLAFGFVLVGVAIDYPIHIMNHHALAPTGAAPRETVRRIRMSLLASGLTTTVAFSALAGSDFPGLEEMGTFGAVGVPVALAVALLSVPAFLSPAGSPTRFQRVLRDALVRGVHGLGERPRLALAIPLAFAAIAAAGLPQLRWQDDPATLMAADPELLAEDERVRRRVADVDGGRFVVAVAPDPEAALQLNDRIYRRLEGAAAEGHLEGLRSLHSFIWSQALQRENLVAFRAETDLGERIDRVFSRQGFRPGSFRGFAEAVASPVAEPLRPEDLAGSPLERALDSMTELDGRWAVVTYLRGVHSAAAAREALDGLGGAYFVDQTDIVAQLYEGYRRSTLSMVTLGSVAVFAILQLRYRSFRRGLLAFLPSALVVLATLGAFGLLGLPVNVVAAISLVVILGIGVDYGIFTVDGAAEPAKLGATMTSLVVSCLTTLLVFGALALSGQPVLRAIGLTTGTGIVLALLLCPAIDVLARPGRTHA